ncbi:MAG: type III pantothenate kinase [Desulfovibrionaceae bacterium]
MAGWVLLFDVGNTTMKMGVAPVRAQAGKALAASFALPTDLRHTADSLGLALAAACAHAGVAVRGGDGAACGNDGVAACVAASVVPAMERPLRDACAKYFGQKLLLAPGDIPIPLANRYERPGEVGADRLVTAYAAHALHPAPAHIVVDFGTATTFDCVRDGAYLGGLICPGVLSSAGALASQTAKLPQVNLAIDPGELAIGRSTADSLNQGLVYGFAAMTEGLCARLKAKLGGDVRVVGTGGLAARIAPVAPVLDTVVPDLLLEGLFLLYKAQQHGTSV